MGFSSQWVRQNPNPAVSIAQIGTRTQSAWAYDSVTPPPPPEEPGFESGGIPLTPPDRKARTSRDTGRLAPVSVLGAATFYEESGSEG